MSVPAPDPQALPPWLPALLQLASPTLPIGSFSYSQGLEAAVWAGVVADEAQAQAWIASHWRYAFAARELPVVARVATRLAAESESESEAESEYEATRQALAAIDADFIASRDSAEARAETRQTGASLLRWLHGLHAGSRESRLGRTLSEPGLAPSAPVAWSLCASAQGLPVEAARFGWGYAWLENQVMAAVRIVPLGQSAGQRMLVALRGLLAEPDPDAPWSFAPLASVLAMRHERQYTRLFRS
jgi:urease accessory protein